MAQNKEIAKQIVNIYFVEHNFIIQGSPSLHPSTSAESILSSRLFIYLFLFPLDIFIINVISNSAIITSPSPQ